MTGNTTYTIQTPNNFMKPILPCSLPLDHWCLWLTEMVFAVAFFSVLFVVVVGVVVLSNCVI